MKLLLTLLALPLLVRSADNYTAEKIALDGIEVVHLNDSASGVSVSIAPSLGNRAFEMKVHGQNLLYFPFPTLAGFLADGAKQFNGIPFLAPWANRLTNGGFWADDKWFRFNPDVGTVHLDSNKIAIHGMLSSSPLWEIVELKADEHSARLSSRLQFWKYPELMANWPFAHEYDITYTLTAGTLEVSTRVVTLGARPMPIAVGFHPYFCLPGVPRAEASVHIPARRHVEMDALSVATGELKPSNLPDLVSLKDHSFDDGYTDLARESDGRALFSFEAGSKKIEVLYGPRYPVAIVFAPPGKPFVCFEPMTAITNALNLAHNGKYTGLQSVLPGNTWQESFWVRSRGY